MTSSDRRGEVNELLAAAAAAADRSSFNFETGMVMVDQEAGPQVCEPEAPLRDDRSSADFPEGTHSQLVGLTGSETPPAAAPSIRSQWLTLITYLGFNESFDEDSMAAQLPLVILRPGPGPPDCGLVARVHSPLCIVYISG